MQALGDRFGISYDDLADQEAAVAATVTDELRALYERYLAPHVGRYLGASAACGPVRFPWHRLFEIEVPIEIQRNG